MSQVIYLKSESREVFLKALYIKQGNPATNDGKLVKDLSGHILSDLCKRTRVPLLKNEELLLNKLTEAILFWGRYPVPLQFAKWRPSVKGVKGIQPVYIWYELDNQVLEQIIKKISDLIDVKSDKSLPWNHS